MKGSKKISNNKNKKRIKVGKSKENGARKEEKEV